MQPEQIIGQLLGGLVGRKRSRRSGLLGMVMGRRGRGSLLTGGTLLTAAGLVWGALESMQKSTVPTNAGGGLPPSTPSPVVPPPLPGSGGAVVPPPLPTAAAAVPDVASLLPLLHLAISAARADGELSAEEQSLIRDRARDLGVSADVDRAFNERPPLESLTAAFTTEEQRRAAYAIALAVVRGDGVVAPGERMYLTQLARLLRLPAEDIETIERDTLGEE